MAILWYNIYINKYTHKVQQAWSALKSGAKKHSDFLASVACGALMGVLFVSVIQTYQAQRFTQIPRPTEMLHLAADLIPPTEETSSESSVSSSEAEQSEPEVQPTIVIEESSSSSSVEVVSSSVSSSIPAPKPVAPIAPKPVASPDVSSSQQNVEPRPVPVSSSSSSVASSASSIAPEPEPVPTTAFPAFDHASFPVGRVPNWGAMHSAAVWNRTNSQMTDEDFVKIPRYDMNVLTTPMESLEKPWREENVPAITAKLFYSTRFFGSYDLDAGEYTGTHVGVDLKLARGAPVGAIGGGRVNSVQKTQTLGLHVVIEHRLKNGETYYSVYGHFDKAAVNVGDDVVPGQTVGYVGMTGNTSAPHLHLQVDRGSPGENHIPVPPGTSGDVGSLVVNPLTFISTHRSKE